MTSQILPLTSGQESVLPSVLPSQAIEPAVQAAIRVSSIHDMHPDSEWNKIQERADELKRAAVSGHGIVKGSCGHKICGCRCDGESHGSIVMTLDEPCRDCQQKQSMEPTLSQSFAGLSEEDRMAEVLKIANHAKTMDVDSMLDYPTMPMTPEWGLPAGPLPLIMRPVEQTPTEQVCPHCQQIIHEKHSYHDFDSGKSFHKDCRGEFIPPPPSPEVQAFLSLINSTIGLQEGLLKCEDGKLTRTEKPSVLISEAMAKGVQERIHRRTRRTKGLVNKKIGPSTPRKSADNDPTKTSRGRSNFRGTKKRSQDADKLKHPEKFTEAVEFLRSNYGHEMDVVLEYAAQLHDPVSTLELLGSIDTSKLDKNWVERASNAIITMLEGREFKSSKFFALAEDKISQTGAKQLVSEDITRIKKYMPDAWVERRSMDTGVISYRVHGFRGLRYEQASLEGLVEAI